MEYLDVLVKRTCAGHKLIKATFDKLGLTRVTGMAVEDSIDLDILAIEIKKHVYYSDIDYIDTENLYESIELSDTLIIIRYLDDLTENDIDRIEFLMRQSYLFIVGVYRDKSQVSPIFLKPGYFQVHCPIDFDLSV